jgi:hypothetical protein
VEAELRQSGEGGAGRWQRCRWMGVCSEREAYGRKMGFFFLIVDISKDSMFSSPLYLVCLANVLMFYWRL